MQYIIIGLSATDKCYVQFSEKQYLKTPPSSELNVFISVCVYELMNILLKRQLGTYYFSTNLKTNTRVFEILGILL